MFKLFSSTGPEFEGTSDQLRKHLGSPRTSTKTRANAQTPRTATRFDPTRLYRDPALSAGLQQPVEPATATVASLMARPPVSITTVQHMGDAWRLLQQHDIAQLVVLDPPFRLVGMLTRTAILKCLVIRHGQISFISGDPITALMQQPVIAVSESEDVRQAALLMLERGINALPVIDNRDRLTGVISRHDILGFLARARPLTLRA
ncbi:CBS domain-containing protein [Marinobacterium rhizophilum]|uniref:CBS domain-containing protein n=1 Tax=Marinobacterium rhizophilum TaxID=420402 RepID=A0ABY5HQ98_9GAMM|nr:CBS domain-containing protein [Marinobacterium rhizophilum]UTW13384.1 CBS domain-containing protein [Marinobacterium rhizophilum]